MHYREVASAKAGTEEPEHEESRLSALCWLPLFSSFFFFAPSRLRVKNIGSTRLTDEPEYFGAPISQGRGELYVTKPDFLCDLKLLLQLSTPVSLLLFPSPFVN